MSNLKPFVKALKQTWQEAPFFSGMALYLLLLILKWQGINNWLVQFRTWLQIVFLSLPALLLWLYARKKQAKLKQEHIATFREARILPKHYIERLKCLLPTNQLTLFNEALMPSLTVFYATFIELRQEEYFSAKYETLCQTITKLRAIPTLYSNQASLSARDLALTAFSFYRILFKDLATTLAKNQNLEKTSAALKSDPYLLIKRVPAKLNQIFGAQYWRVYEFYTAVYGAPGELCLNQDLADFLKQAVLDDENKENATTQEKAHALSKTALKAQEPILTNPPLPAPIENQTQNQTQNCLIKTNRDTTEKSVTQKSDSESENIPPGLSPAETSQTQTPSRSPQKTAAEKQTEKQTEKIARSFIDWLSEKINSYDKRYAPNSGDYIFLSSYLYSANTLFISNDLLNFYYSIKYIAPKELKDALLKQGILDNRIYQLKRADQTMPLLRLNKMPQQKTASKKVTIEEIITKTWT